MNISRRAWERALLLLDLHYERLTIDQRLSCLAAIAHGRARMPVAIRRAVLAIVA